MANQAARLLQALLLLTAVPLASAVTSGQPQDEFGLIGYVLAPDGTPVSGGSVVSQAGSPASFSRVGLVTATIERTGRFRVVPNTPGPHQLFVSAPGLAPYRVIVTVPPSKTLKLPAIRLWPASYFRIRFVSTAGEAITAPQLRRLSLDAPPDYQVPEQIDGDGTMTMGPLPLGRTMLALDTPSMAQTRLPDLNVTHEGTLLDGGTVTVAPGAVLHVDVVDENGGPLSGRYVFIEDARPLSPLGFRRAMTDRQGRATFDRLGTGRYRLRTAAAGPCGSVPLSISRLVSVSGTGDLHTRLVAGGTAAVRLGSPVGPVSGALVWASPDPDLSQSPPPVTSRGPLEFAPFGGRPLVPLAPRSACRGTTDAHGRVTFQNFPPGPARIDVRLPNSTYVRLVSVPGDGRDVVMAIPEGLLPARVTNAVTKVAVAGANVTWTGGGARVEAHTSGDGHALLEGVGESGGILEVLARGYQPAETRLPVPPAMLHEVALLPEPITRVLLRVVTASGDPVQNAVAELSPENPLESAHVAATDVKGIVDFPAAPAGLLRLTVIADGFVTSVTRIAKDRRGDVVVTLSKDPLPAKSPH
jgi:hypothetical protein